MKKCVLLLGFTLSINLLVIAQEARTLDSREFFLNSRIKKAGTSSSEAKATKRPAKKVTADKTEEVKNVTQPETNPIGLGYTLYLRDENDNGIRVDPERIFKSGDAVRLSLEPNIDGYLYIFYVENEGEPELLYPNARLNNGDNSVKAHVPVEIPSRDVKELDLRWFFFSGDPAKEKLYVLVAKTPLPKVPIGKELILYYEKNKIGFKPSNETWKIVKTKANEPNLTSKSKDYGQKQTEIENKAITRKLGLGNNAPVPSIIQTSKSSSSDIFATLVELTHK